MVPIPVTSKAYGSLGLSVFAKELNYSADSIKAMLTTSAYVPNQDTHRYKSSITNEVVGTGYTAGGVALAGKTITYDAASNTVTLKCNNPAWATSTITARYLVFYDDTPAGDAAKPLIAYVDFGADVSSSASTFTYIVPTSGICQLIFA